MIIYYLNYHDEIANETFCWVDFTKYRLVVDVLQAMKRAVVQVILTWEKWIPPIPNKLLDSVDILQQKETELCRLTGMPTETF